MAYLHRDCTVYRAEGFQALSKVEVSGNGRRAILAVLNVVDDECIVGPDELGLSEQAFAQLGLAGGPAAQRRARRAAGLDRSALRRKIAGERLARDDLHGIIRDIAQMRYSKIELAAFVVASNQFETGPRRGAAPHRGDGRRRPPPRLARAAGGRQALHRRHPGQPHLDAGGADRRRARHADPQDLVAARSPRRPAPPTRWRCWPQVELPFERLAAIVRDDRAAAWPGAARADLSPADDVLIAVERPLGIDSPGQMVASILSKKIAAGSTHLVLDIPVGPERQGAQHARGAAAAQAVRVRRPRSCGCTSTW